MVFGQKGSWSLVRVMEVGGSGRSGLDSIAVSLFGNMTVEPREIHIITKEYQNKRSK